MHGRFQGHGTEGHIRKGCVWETSKKKVLKMQFCFLKLGRARDIFLSAVGIQCVSQEGMFQEEPKPVVQHANEFYLISGVWLLIHESLL